MEPRLAYRNAVSKEALNSLYALEHSIRKGGLPAVVAINSWNRIAIAFRAVPGSYQRGA